MICVDAKVLFKKDKLTPDEIKHYKAKCEQDIMQILLDFEEVSSQQVVGIEVPAHATGEMNSSTNELKFVTKP